MAYEFVKEKDGIKAPGGFHYMPNGKLMSDADHIAMNGYNEKTINSITMNLNDISCLGENRSFSISGSVGGFFSLEVYDNSNNYYDFYKKTWSSTFSKLSKVKIEGEYSGLISFPARPSGGLKSYTINLIAEIVENVKTKHPTRREIRNADNSININKSVGSNSNILQRVLYQDVAKTLTLNCIAPSQYGTITDTVDGAVSTSNRIVMDNTFVSKNLVVGDLITGSGTLIAIWNLIDKLDPDSDNPKEIQCNQVVSSISDGVTLTFTPPFNGITPHFTDSVVGVHQVTTSSGANFKVPFEIEVLAPNGRTIGITKVPTTNDLCALGFLTFGSAALAIEGEDTSSSTYYRWPVTNIAGLSGGMVLDPSRDPESPGANTTKATISSYSTTISSTSIIDDRYSPRIVDTTLVDITVPAVDAYGNDVTAVDRNGEITAQAGNIVFNVQQADALKADTDVKIFGYGKSQIKSLTKGMEVSLSDMKVELAQISTETSAATSASTTIGLDEVRYIGVGSVVRGPGISASAANPTVVSKSARSGAGNIIVSSAQTLEDNQTLYFDGRGTTLTITGTIEVSNMAIANTTLYFDLEKFLHVI